MKLEVNITKTRLFIILGAFFLIGGFVFVYAYGTNNPPVFGHTLSEIDGITCPSGQAVTRNASGWGCINVGGGSGALNLNLSLEYYFGCGGGTIPGLWQACFLTSVLHDDRGSDSDFVKSVFNISGPDSSGKMQWKVGADCYNDRLGAGARCFNIIG